MFFIFLQGIINLFSAYELPDFDPAIDLLAPSPYYRLLKNYLMDVLLQPEFSQTPAEIFRSLGLLPKSLVYTVLRDEMLVARTITSGEFTMLLRLTIDCPLLLIILEKKMRSLLPSYRLISKSQPH